MPMFGFISAGAHPRVRPYECNRYNCNINTVGHKRCFLQQTVCTTEIPHSALVINCPVNLLKRLTYVLDILGHKAEHCLVDGLRIA